MTTRPTRPEVIAALRVIGRYWKARAAEARNPAIQADYLMRAASNEELARHLEQDGT